MSHDMSVTPKARASARRIARTLAQGLAERSPKSEIATVADIDFHQSQGYVTCTASRGPVRVLGIPYNSVVPGMRIFMRRISSQGQTSYLYDGLVTAAVTNSMGGSVAVTTGIQPAAAMGTLSAGVGAYTGATYTIPNTVPDTGMFWSFFFYLSKLPAPGFPVTLLETAVFDVPTGTSIIGSIRFVINHEARLGVELQNAGNLWPALAASASGIYYADQRYSPHQVWWVNYQIGIGLSVNGIRWTGGGNGPINSLGSNLLAGPQNCKIAHFLLGNYRYYTAPYTGSPNPASWISKVVIGGNVDPGSPVTAVSPFTLVSNPADDATNTAAQALAVPGDDTQLISLGAVTYGLAKYLCSDSITGGATLLDSSGNGLDLTVDSAYGVLREGGPY